jgi:ABC-type microcin C transport system duplicated ATPase subunit YejF
MAASVGHNRAPVLDVVNLKKHFPVKKGVLRRTVGQVYAVDDVTFRIGEGETLGLVGESGCGKSTVARTVLRLIEPTAGSIKLDGNDVTRLGKTELRPYRRQMQIIFQDPFSSLNPRMSAGDIVGEPLQVHDIAHGKEKQKLVGEIFDQVGLRRSQMSAFPHEFSGGQRQRISIARALSLNPKLIVADEPVSALDARNGCPICSSRTTSRWSSTSAIASRSCISARSSNTPTRRRCSPTRCTPIPRRSCRRCRCRTRN